MTRRPRRALLAVALACVAATATACSGDGPTTAGAPGTSSSSHSSSSAAGRPAATAGAGVYAHAGAGMLNDVTRQARSLVYVPNSESNTVDVIDPKTFQIVEHFAVGRLPQHVVPSYDMKTLWVNDNAGNDLTPIDPTTGKPGAKVPVEDPYNLYFTPGGKSAMVMAEALRRIDFRDPQTMKLEHSLAVPCRGVNHADFTADGSMFMASCEFSGKLIVVPSDGSAVAKVIDLNSIVTPGATDPNMARSMGGPAGNLERGASAMPQDVRLSADGSTYLVADMLRNGVWLFDAKTFQQKGFVPTGKGAHGLYPSRDASVFFVSNRDEGSISVLDGLTFAVRAKWAIPGGGSPDMGGVTADGSQLWLSGRYNRAVYVIDTKTGALIKKIAVGSGPHGLCVWPQPGRYSLGHTGNTR